MAKANALKSADRKILLGTLQSRFETHAGRHQGLDWSAVERRLAENPEALWALHEMERTGGEPDVVAYDSRTGECHVVDCSPESPRERRSLCYDRAALDARKEAKPRSSAMEMAAAMGVALLTEEQYRHLQTLGEFDRKTSSWLQTPERIRRLGGAIFGDRRYDTVFTYHNGAESYYAARGFRSLLKV